MTKEILSELRNHTFLYNYFNSLFLGIWTNYPLSFNDLHPTPPSNTKNNHPLHTFYLLLRKVYSAYAVLVILDFERTTGQRAVQRLEESVANFDIRELWQRHIYDDPPTINIEDSKASETKRLHPLIERCRWSWQSYPQIELKIF